MVLQAGVHIVLECNINVVKLNAVIKVSMHTGTVRPLLRRYSDCIMDDPIIETSILDKHSGVSRILIESVMTA
jgi:hypothetical protein